METARLLRTPATPLVALLLDCGLRIQEALDLRRDQVDLENLLVKVKGKGEKHRIVPISFELRRILHRWLTKHRFELVFPTMQDYAATWYYVQTKNGLKLVLSGSGLNFSWGVPSNTDVWASYDYLKSCTTAA